MLLRASRAAGQLTKEAIVGSLARGAGRLAVGVGKHTLGVVGRNPLTAAGTALVGTAVAPEISRAVQKSQVGLSAPWLQAANAGQVPHVPTF